MAEIPALAVAFLTFLNSYGPVHLSCAVFRFYSLFATLFQVFFGLLLSLTPSSS